jgi:tyrosinase
MRLLVQSARKSREFIMIGRRQFVAGAAITVAAPYVMKTRAHAQSPRVRRDVQSLSASDSFFAKYGQAVQAMHQLPASDPRNWRNQALIHINHCPHGEQDFVHWHRHYILNFERICGQLIGDANFALAYWNWSSRRGVIPDPFYDLNFLNVQFWQDPSNAQSDNWSPFPVTTVGTRGLAKGQGLQDDSNAGADFTQDAIDGIQQQTIFEIFTAQVEGSPHNNGHVVSGRPNGHMIDGVSSLDPIFWLHHCNVDRVWAEWQAAGNTTPSLNRSYSNQFVDGSGQPVSASSASALDFAAMNYTYDTLSAPAVAAAQQQLGLEQSKNQAGLLAQNITVTPQTLGVNDTQKVATTAMETRYSITANDLLARLFRPRTFRATKVPAVQRLAVGSGRILARLSVKPPERETPLICKVFVDCPYLAPDTPSTDPHYAASFSFFGLHGGSHGHAEFYIDVTRPLRTLAGDGRIVPDRVNVQLMPVPAGPGISAQVTFNVERVELLGV